MSNENWVNYIVARNKASSTVRKAKKEYEYRIAKEIKSNPKCFWNMVREKTKVKEGTQDLQAENGSSASSDSDKSVILNKYFASGFTKENLTTVPAIDKPVDIEPIERVQIAEERILKLLGGLKSDKLPGPDKIDNRVLLECKEQLMKPLKDIFIPSLYLRFINRNYRVLMCVCVSVCLSVYTITQKIMVQSTSNLNIL